MTVYAGSKYLKMLKKGYAAASIKLEMGKCCVRFKKLERVHLPTIGRLVAACPVDDFIRLHEAAHKT